MGCLMSVKLQDGDSETLRLFFLHTGTADPAEEIRNSTGFSGDEICLEMEWKLRRSGESNYLSINPP